MTCYTCGSPHHYSDHCPNKRDRKETKCYNCGNFGHKRDSCPNQKQTRNRNIVANPTLDVRSNQNRNIVAIPTTFINCRVKSTLIFKSMWGSESALISEESFFFRLKMEFMNILAATGTITEIDERNKIPHINIHGNSELYEKLNNSTYIITLDSFVFENNSIMLKFLNCHYTLCFYHGIADSLEKIQTLKSIISNILNDYNTEFPEYICCICTAAKYNMLFLPCKHVSCCNSCGSNMKVCPICRSEVNFLMQIYLS
jgi:hypothetical protein